MQEVVNYVRALNHGLVRLEELGILREFTGYARNRRFRFEPYLVLFEDPADSVM